VSLAILQRLTDAQAAVDAQGQPLLPLPVAHRHIASLRCLPHIVQVRRCCIHAVPAILYRLPVQILRTKAIMQHDLHCGVKITTLYNRTLSCVACVTGRPPELLNRAGSCARSC